MKIIINPANPLWQKIIQRPHINQQDLFNKVTNIIAQVKTGGDKAIIKLTKQFDGITLNTLLIDKAAIKAAKKSISPDLKNAIKQAFKNIYTFHQIQKNEIHKIDTMEGVACWQKMVPIEKIGLYIPGGSAPLFSTILMLGIPAKIAQCKQVILCTPPNKNNQVHPAILYTASLVGIKEIYSIGGAQAIAAMACGTKTIPQVYKIFGPGNQFVTAAKQWVQLQGTAIDMPAGPTELCILMDETADIRFVAADILAQVEHGADSQVIIITNQQKHIAEIKNEVQKQLSLLPRKNIAGKALLNSKIIYFSSTKKSIDFINLYAPEHLIIVKKDADLIAEKIINAGSIFIGNYSPEAVGDYASGTNHTLPTSGFAKMYSGVNLDSFYKKITFQKLTKTGLSNLAKTVTLMADAEQLQGHSNSVKIRLI
ncbi:MAG: histidinol dehydrogenase [Sediminibacterium sp.]|nr:histidinol dehydrogenase [Sediminibacterium sp.]